MTRTKVAILSAGLFVLGSVLGAYAGFTYATGVLSDMLVSFGATSSVASAATHVRTLQRLRDARLDSAIEFLETSLDSDLMSIGAYDKEYLPAYAPKILRMAAEYRAKYPHKGASAEVDSAVQRALTTTAP